MARKRRPIERCVVRKGKTGEYPAQFGRRQLVKPGRKGKRKPVYRYLVKPGQKGKRKPTWSKKPVRARTPKRASDQFNPLSPLTGKQFSRELDAATKLQFSDQDRQVESERRISNQAQTNVDNWYTRGYLPQIEAARQRTLGAYQGAQSAITGAANQAYATDMAAQQRIEQQAARSADVRGVTPGLDNQRDAREAASARQALSNSFAGLTGLHGAAQNAYIAQQGNIAAGQRVADLKTEQGRRRKIEEVARDIAGKKGAFKTEYRSKARESERDYFLKSKALEVDVAEAAADAWKDKQDLKQKAAALRESRRATNKRLAVTKRGQNLSHMIAKGNLNAAWKRIAQTDRTYRLNEKKFGHQIAQDKWKRAHPGVFKGGSGGRSAGPTPAATISTRKAWRILSSAAKRTGKVPKYKDQFLRRAAAAYVDGSLSKRTSRILLRDYGLHVPASKRKKNPFAGLNAGGRVNVGTR